MLQRARRKTEKRRDVERFLAKGPADVLDHATNEITLGNKRRIDATKMLVR